MHARTRALGTVPSLIELLEEAGSTGFVWHRDGLTLVTSDLRIAGDADALAGIPHEDHVGRPGSGPIAVGALPFGGDSPDAQLSIPIRVVGIDADGAWCTELEGDDRVEPMPDRSSRETNPTHHEPAADRAHWDAMLDVATREIETGRIDKVVLARAVDLHTSATRARVLRRLIDHQPGCFVFADGGFVGATPELLVRRHGAAVTSCPMAGTTTLDAASRLCRSDKDAREHRFVIDAVTEVLRARCASVTVPEGPEVRRFANYAHLVTPIEAELAPGSATSALALALALHPTPAVAGTPTATARALIAELEGFDRGSYAGPVGWLDARGDGEFAVALRCAELTDGAARAFAGAGIVAGSDPDAEWAETEAKLAVMVDALTD